MSTHVIKHGFVNIYRSDWFHRRGKPLTMDRHTGDIYDTYEQAIKDIDPPSHYIATVGISWADVEDVQANPADSIPVPLSVSRRQVDNFEDIKPPVVPSQSSPIHDPWGLSRLG